MTGISLYFRILTEEILKIVNNFVCMLFNIKEILLSIFLESQKIFIQYFDVILLELWEIWFGNHVTPLVRS